MGVTPLQSKPKPQGEEDTWYAAPSGVQQICSLAGQKLPQCGCSWVVVTQGVFIGDQFVGGTCSV